MNNSLVAVGASAGEASGENRRFHASQRLVDEVLEEDGPEQARDRELDLVDVTLADRVQLDAVVGQFLAQPGHVLGITRETVQGLAGDKVDFAVLNRPQQLFEAGTVSAIARQFGVKPRRRHRAAEIADQRST
nr:hypothetical protein [Sphingomonas gellani]